jgi:hypothetical protein
MVKMLASCLGIVTDVCNLEFAGRFGAPLDGEPHHIPDRVLTNCGLNLAHGADFLAIDRQESFSTSDAGPR